MDSLCEKMILKVSMNGPNINKSFLPFSNAKQKNSELSIASWCESSWLTFEEAYALFNIFDESPWQRTDYETMTEAATASQLHLNLVSINPGYYVFATPSLKNRDRMRHSAFYEKLRVPFFLQCKDLLKNWSLRPQYFQKKSVVRWTRGC